MKITQYRALGFSCYGTLIDRDGGVLEGLRSLLTHIPANWLMARYQHLCQSLHAEAPALDQATLHQRVYLQLARDLQKTPEQDAALAFGNSAGHWPVFEDTPGALQYLSKFYRLLLISPADMGDASALAARLPVAFDAIVVNDGQKALQDALNQALEGLALERADLLPVRSPAQDDPWQGVVDFPVCTLRRRHGQPWQKASQAIDVKRCEYASMADLVHAHQIALRA